MTKKDKETGLNSHSGLAKAASILIFVCAITALILTEQSAKYLPPLDSNKRYFFENLGITFIFLSLVFAIVLKQLQRSTYWMYWLKLDRTELDERQEKVKRKVYARAYITMAALFVLSAGPLLTDNNQFPLILLGIIFFISLPSIFAAWEKDS